VADPIVVAARELLDEALEGLREAVDGAAVDTLNLRPAGDQTNSIAVLVAHALYSTRSWLSLAVGAPLPPRDRPAEFRTVATDVAGIGAQIDVVGGECRGLLSDDTTFDPTIERTPTWRQGPDDANEATSAAWALVHAISHLKEHVAHAQLTRQILDADQAGG
jgi:DinB superfamily